VKSLKVPTLLLDFNGNEIKRFSSHAAPVNDISFDARGEFTASCADDGTVVRGRNEGGGNGSTHFRAFRHL
jgi:WD40 repeat protein